MGFKAQDSATPALSLRKSLSARRSRYGDQQRGQVRRRLAHERGHQAGGGVQVPELQAVVHDRQGPEVAPQVPVLDSRREGWCRRRMSFIASSSVTSIDAWRIEDWVLAACRLGLGARAKARLAFTNLAEIAKSFCCQPLRFHRFGS